MVDFMEFSLPNLKMCNNGMVNMEEQEKINDCIEISNQIYGNKSNNSENEEKKDSIDMEESKRGDEKDDENGNKRKYGNIINWRSYGYFSEVQFITAMNKYKNKCSTVLNDFKFKQFHNAYCDQTTFRLEILMANDMDEKWDEKLKQDLINLPMFSPVESVKINRKFKFSLDKHKKKQENRNKDGRS